MFKCLTSFVPDAKKQFRTEKAISLPDTCQGGFLWFFQDQGSFPERWFHFLRDGVTLPPWIPNVGIMGCSRGSRTSILSVLDWGEDAVPARCHLAAEHLTQQGLAIFLFLPFCQRAPAMYVALPLKFYLQSCVVG